MKKILVLLAIVFSVPAHAALTLLDHNDWKVDFYGFAELDAMSDSTRSLTEIVGNSPVDRPATLNGQAGRMQFSVRNSRFGFAVAAPEYDGWKTRAQLEMDFYGFDLATSTGNTTTSAQYYSQTENSYYNSPTLRVRHAYMSGEKNGWQILAGQTWNVLGWQPYYFIPALEVQPLPGQIFSRNGQIRALKTMGEASGTQFQAEVAALRSPQRDGNLPSLEAGFRVVDNSRKAAYTNATSMADATQAMSFAVSGTARRISIPADNIAVPSGNKVNFTAGALAANALLPIIASSDGKSVGNTFAVGGEYSIGSGYADEFVGYTDSQASQANNGYVAGNYQIKNTNLDPGIGGYDNNNLFHLINLQTFSVYGQYHFSEESRTWTSAGYNALSSNNAANVTNLSSSSAVAYNRQTAAYANLVHNLTPNLRVGVEYSYIQTTYSDTLKNHNNRYQLSSFFFF